MGNIEQLQIWQTAIELSVQIYELTNQNENLKKDFGLKDQIQRASVSIASNIAEGGDRQTQKEFMQFLCIARGSCSELKTQIVIINNLGFLSNEEFISLNNTIISLHKMMNGMIHAVSKNIKKIKKS